MSAPATGGPASALRERYDVVIAGARVAGAATGRLLARAGARVLVVDPVPPERDALSTHGLMRGGVLQLHRWGLLDAIRAAGTPPIRTTVFHYGDNAVPFTIKPSDGIDALYAPRRTVLDGVLAGSAAAAGARVVHGAALVDLVRDGERVRGALVRGPTGEEVRIDAELVVGADGLNSRLARLVDAPTDRVEAHATATVYGYWPDLDDGEYHWYFGRGVSAGTISTNGGESCVFAILPSDEFPRRRHIGLEALHREVVEAVSPELAGRLASRKRSGKLHAFAGTPGFIRRSAGPGWALVGDAGYFKDPATAHGITDALRDAELLARGWLQDGEAGLRSYEATRNALVGGLLEVTDRISSFDWTLDEVQSLHKTLAAEMNAGVDLIRELDGADGRTGADLGGRGPRPGAAARPADRAIPAPSTPR